ncbi:hypothetical protein MYXO_00819 [Myxococcaceae bacterium]|jgi:hypothetical protein|nr:hypothetical protein MYXO_00819 [Myxococcaceae bacterium]
MDRSWAVLVAVAMLVSGLWLGLLTKPALPGLDANPPHAIVDFWHYYRPNVDLAAARIKGGDLPLWDDRQGLGGPFLATLQAGVLYPPNALTLLLPSQESYTVLMALHLALGAFFAGALARALGAGWRGAIVAAIGFGFSPYMLFSVWTPPILYAAAWLPGVLLGVDRLLAAPSAPRVAALAVAAGMQALAGWPYLLLLTTLGAGALAIGALLEPGGNARANAARGVTGLALAAGLAFLLAAPQLLPTFEIVGETPRAFGTLDSEQAIFIDVLHEPRGFFGRLFERGVSDGIPGIAVLVLAPLAAILRGPGRLRASALLFAGVLALLISFADHTPVYGWMRSLPLFGDFRFPMRYRLLSTLTLAVCAGVGLEQALRAVEVRSRTGAFALLAIAVVGIGVQVEAVRSRQAPFARSRGRIAPDLAVTAVQSVVPPRPQGGRVLWDDRARREEEAVGFDVINYLEPLSPASTARVLTYLERGEASTLERNERAILPYFGHAKLPEDGSRRRILDVLGIRFVVSSSPPEWVVKQYPARTSFRGRPFVFENPDALPRTWRVARAEPASDDPQATFERLVSPAFDPRSEVLLEGIDSAQGEPSPDPSRDRAELVVSDPERLVIRSEGATPGWVVVSDAWFPGWEARVDEAPTVVLRANGFGRAVAVPAGSSEVEFVYRPAGFRTGMFLASIGGIGVAACLLAARFGPRTERRD